MTFDDDLGRRLEARARATGVPPDEIVAQALRKFLAEAPSDNAVYLSAPLNALVEGIYCDDTTYAKVKRHGDFGIGTFNDLDGEMVMLDGRIFRIGGDGAIHTVEESVKTPFACVCHFTAHTVEEIDRPLDHHGLMALLEDLLPSRNMLYAIRVDGLFSRVRVRSVARQEEYRPLVEVAREQAEFVREDVKGTLAGFWTPSFLASVSVPGWHLHFLSDDLKTGGHLLDCASTRMTVALQHVPRLRMDLPVTLDFLTADFTRDMKKDLDEAER
ncbi:MAG: acetolactate decarboxylase [Alphaproteobacteria bacterium]|nr:acetolactate decarboxylase [Alphaproteobacteria bacterium]